MTANKQKVIIAGVSLTVLFFGQFVGFYKKGSSAILNRSNKTSTQAKAPEFSQKGSVTPMARAIGRLQGAKTSAELLEIMKKLLEEDEQLAIEAFAALNSNSPALNDPYVLTSFFKSYLSKRYRALEGLDKLTSWREKKPGFFKQAAVDLLSDHSSKDDPLKVIEFLNHKENAHFASLVYQDAGYELSKGDPAKMLKLIDQLKGTSAQEAFREGIFSRWIVEDAVAVANHLNGIELDQSYDNILERFVERSANDLNEDYLEWANLIKNPEIRKNNLVQIAQRWVQDPDYHDDYQAWKNSLGEADQEVLNELAQYEKEYAQRREIRDDFGELFTKAREASQNGEGEHFQKAINGIVNSMRALMKQLTADPNNLVLRQELDTVHQKISNDYWATGGLPPNLETVLDDYRELIDNYESQSSSQ